MPATEETYRSQPTLHVVFAVSSIAMLLSIVWMIMADHLRPWKEVQRNFQHVEAAKLEAAKQQALNEQQARSTKPRSTRSTTRSQRPNETREERDARSARSIRRLEKLGGHVRRPRHPKKFMKAELDSQRSLYDGMIDRGEEASRVSTCNTTIKATEQKLFEAHHGVREGPGRAEGRQAKARIDRNYMLAYMTNRRSRGGPEEGTERLTREADRVKRDDRRRRTNSRRYFGSASHGLPPQPPRR